ncbi:MAG: FAD-dependent oxidoreductase [Clostridium sp.]|nr:FAD-dependent oxidoreductase [Clostridium sp.]
MPNMNPKKNPMPSQEPDVRNHNFKEVALGYTEEIALDEAARCLNCKNMPCVNGCPVNIHIPEFIAKIREMDFEGAYQVISRDSSLPAVCGRVCPQETQCESKCVRGIKGEPVGIGRLERFVADWHNAHSTTPSDIPASNGHKVAIVGSGPSGLTCAKEIDNLSALGVDVETNMVIGKTLTIDELFDMGYEAVFIGSGAGLPMFMNIPGENLKGVYSANEFLTRINLMKAYREDSDTPIMHGKHVAVVGGGNVAMDAARCARRLGAEVKIVYRRSESELPARREEVEHAKEEGIEFCLLTTPLSIKGDDKFSVCAMNCQKMELGEPDASGRRRPIPVDGSEYDIDVDCVIMALGTSPNPLIKSTTKGLEVNRKGGIIVEEATGKTSRDAVYAGGDAVTGAATVISAMGAGKTAAKAIDEYLANK